MVKKKLKGKSRQDKYYHLAKETGYRARSAFKLLQLNKKFSFLQSSQVLVDLCAAPGGWLQVASEHMPMSSVIIGVDLVPIRPVPRCITFQDDITKDSCRTQLKSELHKWKVDCFLHDGAPNVGKNWLYDAYSQSVLTLHALKLATEFLRKDGWFITKVFRSKDYQALMWVLGQLFNKVHATKPQASRSESAEIFVVCQAFKAPDKIDKKFFDAKSVFEDIEEKKVVQMKDFAEIKKRKALGYEACNGLLYSRKTISEFLETQTPLKMLSEVNELVFKDPALLKHSLVTKDIIENVKDIKTLGKHEIKKLLKFHSKYKKSKTAPEVAQESTPSSEEDSDEEIERKLQEIKEHESKLLKKKKKTVVKERKKLRERMGHVAQSSHEQDDMELFGLKHIKSAQQLSLVTDINGVPSEDLYIDETNEEFSSSSDINDSDDDNDDEDDGEKSEEKETDQEEDEETVEVDNNGSNPLIETFGDKPDNSLWFSKDIFKKIEEETDDIEEVKHAEKYYETRDKVKAESAAKEKEEMEKSLIEAKLKAYDSGSDSDYDLENNIMHASLDNAAVNSTVKEQKLDAEGLALGTVLATSMKQKRDIIDDSFNRYTFNDDEDLPDWFVEDEKERIRRDYLDSHVPKDVISFYKSKDMNVNARTIKKVAEAKARKKRRMAKRMEKARKQAEAVSESTQMSNVEKSAQLKIIYKKSGLLKKNKENTTYVFAKRGGGQRVRRPPGVTGKIKIVDKRMKKDLRATKNKRGVKKGKPRKTGRGSR